MPGPRVSSWGTIALVASVPRISTEVMNTPLDSAATRSVPMMATPWS
jgi:hypothetical protein